MSREANSNPVLDATLASVVEKIIAKLESGEVPWHKPWTGRSTLPMNPVTGRTNQGIINPIILWLAEEDKGYGDNRWAGFSQWRKSGNPVRKGEKSTVIFMPILRRFKVEGDNGESVLAQRVVGWKFGRVFNNQQTTNPLPRPEVPQVDPSVGFEKAAALVKRVGAKLTHGGNRAFYAPAADRVQLPEPGQFDTLADYWSTNMHEHVHWTGAEERCNRKGIVKFSGFGSPSY
nr:DUF1738 domain-containing protein [Anaerolineae bacterium]